MADKHTHTHTHTHTDIYISHTHSQRNTNTHTQTNLCGLSHEVMCEADKCASMLELYKRYFRIILVTSYPLRVPIYKLYFT